MRINGKETLLHRPMEGVTEGLHALGVTLPDFKGFIPFTVKGPILPQSIAINATHGSQFLSGLLFALAETAIQPITISVKNLKSKPYIDLTLAVLAHFGNPITHHNYSTFFIDPSLFSYTHDISIDIEGDWSGAANLLVAGTIAGQVTVNNLSVQSTQADKAILEVLRMAGANLKVEDNAITVIQSKLTAFDFDATHCPDLFPILAILAALCDGESNIAGVHRLFNKESNRVESIAEMLWDFDVQFSVENDILSITGGRYLQGTIIDSFKDHRIIMAAAVGALRANGPVEITYSESVNKSYPAFFKDLRECGVQTAFTYNNT
jgi:3-phosphoshikimate 1-carboxyvinyltransferase